MRITFLLISGCCATAILGETFAHAISVNAGDYSLYVALALVFITGQLSFAPVARLNIMIGAIAAVAVVVILWTLNYYYVQWLRFGLLAYERQESLWRDFSRFYSWLGAVAAIFTGIVSFGRKPPK